MEGKRSRVRELSHSFPDEIIEEILTRLPVKSLLRFRCVSKSWLSLISSPTFIKAHLKNGINNSMHLQNRLLCISSYPGNHFIEFSFRFIFHAEVDSITSDYNISDPDLPMRIVGSCRGMVCVVLNEDDLYLWNPSIRKYELLPGLHISLGFGFYMKDGFGYDEFNDDYKVVAISYCIFYNGPYNVHIFSLKTNAWKRIEDFICGNPIDRSGKFASGKLHWLVDNDGCLEIVSLNLSSERYGKMGTPHSSANSSRFVALEYDNPCLTLGLFSESLCMLFDDHKRCMDLWVMKEYGITDSWTRIFRMPHLGNPEIFPHMLRIWLLNDHEMLFVYGCVIIICSLGYNGYRYTPINYLLAINQGDVFVESLVSPCVESSDE